MAILFPTFNIYTPLQKNKGVNKMSQRILFNSRSEAPFNKFSNFYHCNFIYKGLAYRSSEHAYQAAKCILTSESAAIRNAGSPLEAKRISRSVKLVADWDNIKVNVMKEVLGCKFIQNEELRKTLLNTKDSLLVHEAPWDNFWGNGKNDNGKNILGLLLMDLRNFFETEVTHR